LKLREYHQPIKLACKETTMATKKSSNKLLNIDRFKGFSDGVIAVSITLLALDLKSDFSSNITSSSDFLQLIMSMHNQIFAYLVAFMLIAIKWVSHYKIFNNIDAVNSTLIRMNLLLLLTITFISFPTSLLAQYDIALAVIFFNIAIILPTIILVHMNYYIMKNLSQFYPSDTSEKDRMTIHKKIHLANIIKSVPIFAIAILSSIICFFNSSAGKFMWYLVIFMPLFMAKVSSKLESYE